MSIKKALTRLCNRYYLVTVVIFLVFGFFRFYHLGQRVIFNWDQERDAFTAAEIVKDGKFTLIGPRVLGPDGFFLPPYFTYLTLPFYALTRLSPYTIVYILVCYQLLFFGCSFWILSRLFSRTTANIFLLLWAIHPAAIQSDTLCWNPLLVPLLSIIAYYLFSLTARPSRAILAAVGISIGLLYSAHFQAIFLLAAIFVTSIITGKNRFKISSVLYILIGFFITLLPLAIFDVRHNFLNIHKFITLFSGGEQAWLPTAWFPVWQNVANGFWGFSAFGILTYLVFLGLFTFLLINFRNQKQYPLILLNLVVWLLFPLGFTLYGSRPSEYYFLILLLFEILSLSLLFTTVDRYRRVSVFLLLFLFISGNLPKSIQLLHTNPAGLYYKDRLISRLSSELQGKRFNLSYSLPPGEDAGFRYLLQYHQLFPTGNPADSLVIVTSGNASAGITTEGSYGYLLPPEF